MVKFKKVKSFAEARKHLSGRPEEKWDQESLDQYRKARFDRERSEYLRKREQQSNAWWDNYERYMDSEDWKKRRAKVLQRDQFTCQACLNREADQVHHISYKHGYAAPLFELISLCTVCHEHLHELERKANQ